MTLFRINAFSGIAVLIGLTFSSESFAAQPTSTTTDAEFIRMDSNKDGRISPDEHSAGAKRMFELMDLNKDGKVTADEMKAAHQRVTGKKAAKSDMTAAEKIKVVDKDRDGTLTAEEHAVGSRTMFEKMDTDKDGFLTKEELAAGQARMLKRP